MHSTQWEESYGIRAHPRALVLAQYPDSLPTPCPPPQPPPNRHLSGSGSAAAALRGRSLSRRVGNADRARPPIPHAERARRTGETRGASRERGGRGGDPGRADGARQLVL
ncbi:hypothetical protein SKAU_G00401830 [Synaphobranchus kaupii]|uniref:Uncharacterized protein n=1 Tax=Synaphobranchus kaupii TaxID=118154 RepID=A0A9Q1ICD7_SYNKA|nr:hypothetical protein SKAU_G00401830 [Synaphobranchus kaupii]